MFLLKIYLFDRNVRIPKACADSLKLASQKLYNRKRNLQQELRVFQFRGPFNEYTLFKLILEFLKILYQLNLFYRFELAIYLEGTSESTGTTMQARYSYRNGDVLWGHRFQSTIDYDAGALNYVIDFDKFEKTISVSAGVLRYNLICMNNCCDSFYFRGFYRIDKWRYVGKHFLLMIHHL